MTPDETVGTLHETVGAPDELIGSRTTRRAPLAMRIAESVATRLAGSRPSRRSLLTTTAVAGSALAVAPWRFLLQPVSAYEAVCGPASDCASGWTVFCCTINNGRNSCPTGSVAAGWWKADQNSFCGGAARYYVDCNSTCGTCGCGSSGICNAECWTCGCRCNEDPSTCDHRRVCCNRFRYGNCNQQIACVGPVVCRVVSCVPPWEWEPACTTVSATANQTGSHHAPCLNPTPPQVHAFGNAGDHGEGRGRLAASTAGIASLPDDSGYWAASTIGGVRAYGNARRYGSLDNTALGKPIVDIVATPTGLGYWLVNSNGRVWTFGDAVHHGSTNGMELVKSIVAMAATPSGNGYWLINSNGRVFAFGDAQHFGSTDPMDLPSRIVAIAPTPTGNGYWLASARGGVYAFGDAQWVGHALGRSLNGAVVDISEMPDGGGYRLVTEAGSVLVFGRARFYGGLGTLDGPHGPTVALQATSDGLGYWIATSPR
jgi:hypothetical protein